MKQLVKFLEKKGACFWYICQMLLALSIVKLNARILDGPQIQILIKDDGFVLHIITAECAPWNSFVLLVKEFLGKTKVSDYKEIVQVMLTDFHVLGVRMRI